MTITKSENFFKLPKNLEKTIDLKLKNPDQIGELKIIRFNQTIAIQCPRENIITSVALSTPVPNKPTLVFCIVYKHLDTTRGLLTKLISDEYSVTRKDFIKVCSIEKIQETLMILKKNNLISTLLYNTIIESEEYIKNLYKQPEFSNNQKITPKLAKDGLFVIPHEKKQLDAIPDDLCCPLSFELMTDPVTVNFKTDKRSYERSVIKEWLEKAGTSPFTIEKLILEYSNASITSPEQGAQQECSSNLSAP
jgi:hypothetical protein